MYRKSLRTYQNQRLHMSLSPYPAPLELLENSHYTASLLQLYTSLLYKNCPIPLHPLTRLSFSTNPSRCYCECSNILSKLNHCNYSIISRLNYSYAAKCSSRSQLRSFFICDPPSEKMSNAIAQKTQKPNSRANMLL